MQIEGWPSHYTKPTAPFDFIDMQSVADVDQNGIPRTRNGWNIAAVVFLQTRVNDRQSNIADRVFGRHGKFGRNDPRRVRQWGLGRD